MNAPEEKQAKFNDAVNLKEHTNAPVWIIPGPFMKIMQSYFDKSTIR